MLSLKKVGIITPFEHTKSLLQNNMPVNPPKYAAILQNRDTGLVGQNREFIAHLQWNT